MPPTLQSIRMEKPDGMSFTWKPRLVKTPTPTMSATTIAVATTTETPGLAVGQTVPEGFDAAISLLVPGLILTSPANGKNPQLEVTQYLKCAANQVIWNLKYYPWYRGIAKPATMAHNHDMISWCSCGLRKWGVFFRMLNVALTPSR